MAGARGIGISGSSAVRIAATRSPRGPVPTVCCLPGGAVADPSAAKNGNPIGPVRLDADPGDTPWQSPATPGELAADLRLLPEPAVGQRTGRNRGCLSHDRADVWQDEYARAFTVSWLTRADLPDALRRGGRVW